jgi:HEAT repeat protein
VPAVVARLQHDSAPHVRLAAIEVIGRLKPREALRILEPLTYSPNEDIARAAIGALGYVDQADALAVVERFLRSPEASRRLAGIEALARRGETRVPAVLQWVAAADQQPDVVTAAVEALAGVAVREDLQGQEATRALTRLTAEPSVRGCAIAALSRLPSRRIAEIATGLRHPVVEVRRATVEALSRMKQPEASRAVESALDDVVPSVRLTAVAELKHLGTRTSQRKLMMLARTDPDEQVRHAAVMAVARTEIPGEDRSAHTQ